MILRALGKYIFMIIAVIGFLMPSISQASSGFEDYRTTQKRQSDDYRRTTTQAQQDYRRSQQIYMQNNNQQQRRDNENFKRGKGMKE